MVREYLINAREKFNEKVKEYSNRIKEGLGDTLTADVTVAAPISIFFGTWIGMNSYTAMQQQASGLCERIHSPEVLERIAANAEMAAQGFTSNYVGIGYGICLALLLGSAIVKLDGLTLREERE